MALARRTVPTSLSVYRAPGSLGSHWNLCQRLPQPRLSWSAHSHQPPLVHEDAIPHPASPGVLESGHMLHPQICNLPPLPLPLWTLPPTTHLLS